MTDPCPTSAPNEPNIRFLARATQLLPGVLLAVVVGQAASVVAQAVGLRAGGLALAIGAGVGLANSPFGRWLKGSYFEDGLRFVTARLLKVAVVMSGLKVQIALFDTSWLVESLAILVVTIPTSFVVAHFMAARLRLRSEVGDLIAIGTMICGASAINALVPVIGAKRSEQGLAITAVSTFSIFAMFVFLPIGKWLQLSDAAFGGWSGLAVGDFSSAVGVGAQFSDAASVIATASKSLRVLLLGPVIVLFSSVRCARRDGASSPPLGWGAMGRHVPGFVIGYLVFCLARSSGDAFFAGYRPWATALTLNGDLFTVFMLTVCAAIGLGIDWRAVRAVGWRIVLAGGVAATAMASVTLCLVLGFHGGPHGRLLAGVLVLLFAIGCLAALRRRSVQASSPHPERSA